jgi:uncharacterized membrane protein YhaH (DUF805 family)
MNWYLKALKQYVDFNGRARRTEFWMFALFNVIISAVLSLLDNVIGTYGVLSGLYSLAVLLPGIAVTIRRLHDIGKSGVWILIAFVPVIGWIWLLILMVQDSQAGENQYGPNPKEVIDAE